MIKTLLDLWTRGEAALTVASFLFLRNILSFTSSAYADIVFKVTHNQ